MSRRITKDEVAEWDEIGGLLLDGEGFPIEGWNALTIECGPRCAS